MRRGAPLPRRMRPEGRDRFAGERRELLSQSRQAQTEG
jgi:hypothetical protein